MPRDSRAEPSPPAAAATGNSFLDGKIGSTEAAWLGGALSLSERKVEQIMTAMDDVVGVFEEDRCDARARPSLPAARPARRVLAGLARRGQPGAPRRPLLPRHSLDFATMLAIYESGHTRIPIFRRSTGSAAPRCAGRKWAGCEVVGLLSTKDLILVDPQDALSVHQMRAHCGRDLFIVWYDTAVNKLFKDFKGSHSHLAFVQRVNDADAARDPFYEVIGIVTLEDILEELIQARGRPAAAPPFSARPAPTLRRRVRQAEIVDETDVFEDNKSKKRVSQEAQASRRMAFHKMLDPRELHDRALDKDEIEAISFFLAANVDHFATTVVSPRILQALLAESTVSVVDDPETAAPMYEPSKPSDLCTVVLQGQLHIVCGSEGFESDRGPWTVLAVGALRQPHYVPDFTARATEPTRFLQISRSGYASSLAEQERVNRLLEDLDLREPRKQPSQRTLVNAALWAATG